VDELQERLGHRFEDPSLLERALTHSSFANEATGVPDNETLEFLGDSVLGLLVAERLVARWPDRGEGALSRAKAHLVSESHFAELARGLGLAGLLRLSESEARGNGRERDALLADAFEAVFAAVYLDAGFPAAREAARRLFEADIEALDSKELLRRDAKTSLQEIVQARGAALPVYRLLEETGPPHLKRFVYEVTDGAGRSATGAGASKKEAQQRAAAALLAQLTASGRPSGEPSP
jgi:ribonuclease III